MEKERNISLFENLYSGHPWIDITITHTLEKITAKRAASRVLPNCNSIWEIVNHMISWRINVLQRLQGKVLITPSNNYIEPVLDTSEDAWKNTLKEFQHTQKEWINFLTKFDVADYEKKYPANGMTYYEHIQGIIQHDAYHLGQIVLLSK